MKRLFLFVGFLAFTFLIVSLSVSGQNRDLIQEMAESYLQVRQKPGTNHLLREYLSTVNSSEDTLYAIIYEPMYCLRCEMAIPACYRLLKKYGLPQHKMLLVTVYSDSVAAAQYNRNNSYLSDYYLYDTDRSFNSIFSFSLRELGTLFFLKLIKSEGRMIAGGDVPVWSEDFISQITAFNTPWEYHEYATAEEDIEKGFVARTPSQKFIKNRFTDYSIDLPAGVAVSNISQSSVFTNSHFFYTDLLNNGVMCFTANNDVSKLHFDGLVRADSLEQRQFVEIPEKDYRNALQNGMVFSMALSPNLLSDTQLGISYSLPWLRVMGEENGNQHHGYFNMAVIIFRNLSSLQPAGSPIELDIDLEDDYFYKHFTFSTTKDRFLMGCQKKTWPMSYRAEEYVDNPTMNPFCDAFYQSNNPFMAALDRNAQKLVIRFGNLEECHHRSYTGYYFTNPLSTTCGNEVLYPDGFSGQLYIVDSDNLNHNKKHHSLFEVEANKFPPVDSSAFHTYEYPKTYYPFFDRQITNIKLTKEEIYCIVHYGHPDRMGEVQKEEFTFARINRKNGKIKEYRLPHYAGCEVLEYGLRTSENQKVTPYIFMKKEGKAFLRVF